MSNAALAARAPLVLVADDDAVVRELVCEVLGEAGFRTLTAADGAEVERLALAHRPALLIIDVMMPQMDGYTTVSRLRGHPAMRISPSSS